MRRQILLRSQPRNRRSCPCSQPGRYSRIAGSRSEIGKFQIVARQYGMQPDGDPGRFDVWRKTRFQHIEDEHGNRATMEIRLTPAGRWSLDTFLLCGDNRRALLDPTRLHPAGRWTWVALRYDGRRMVSFVDGVKELEGAVNVTPFAAGRTALGVRLNQIYWFKGAIREVRFHPRALDAADLQRTK